MSKGAAYFLAGCGMLIVAQGIERLAGKDKETDRNKTLGAVAIITGVALISSPFMSAILGARRDNP